MSVADPGRKVPARRYAPLRAERGLGPGSGVTERLPVPPAPFARSFDTILSDFSDRPGMLDAQCRSQSTNTDSTYSLHSAQRASRRCITARRIHHTGTPLFPGNYEAVFSFLAHCRVMPGRDGPAGPSGRGVTSAEAHFFHESSSKRKTQIAMKSTQPVTVDYRWRSRE